MKTLQEIRGKKTAVFTFGRMNPPTVGHEKLIKKVMSVASSKGATPFIFLSHTQDPKKNPLTNKQKVKFIKLGVPTAAKAIQQVPKIRTPFDAIKYLIDMGYENVIMVVGADRVNDFKKRIQPYIGHPDKKVAINLDSFDVVSAGARDPDSEGVSGMSASKMRHLAIKNNFRQFRKGVPSGLSDRFARELFDLVRVGMRISEEIIRTRGSLGKDRIEMPQITRQDIQLFIRELEREGVPVRSDTRYVSSLKPSQNEVDLDKIKDKAQSLSDGEEPKPFIVSLDNYILDGHHQLYAMKTLYTDANAAVYVVGLKMDDLINFARKYERANFKPMGNK